jgi:signal transduction histidine kinase
VKLISEIQQEFEQSDEFYQKLLVPDSDIEDFPELSKFKFLAYGMNQLLKKKDDEIDNLNKEQQILRGLASSGIVLASFSHDLSALSNVLSSRTDKLKELISPKIKEVEYKDVEARKNPFAQIERIKSQDLKIQNWLKFSIGATRKDKRKRKLVRLKNYFSDLKNDWSFILGARGIDLINSIEDLTLLMHEIDLDSVFNNLLVNSCDAFLLSTNESKRKITTKVYGSNNKIIIDYFDNATGLSKDIINPDDIFQPLYTTKRNPHTAEEIGTGLGMWILKSIVEENSGQVKLLYPEIGFGIRISFPNKTEK